MKTTKSGVSKMDTLKPESPLPEDQETEYCYMCGGIQPFLPEEICEEDDET